MKTALTTLLLVISTISSVLVLSRAADNPHGALNAECTACHTTESWNTLRADMEFDHSETGFRLDGSHRAVKCGNCHRDLVFSHIGTACADCHPDHHLGQLGSVCGDCHTPADWHPREDMLVQHAERGFPLTGVHAVADCQACHRGADRNEFVGTPTECLGCHAEDLARAVDPDHRQPAFAGDCRQCHHAASGSWTRTTYEHPGSFPLTGAHRPLNCARCHPTSFAGTPNTCFGCHDVDYNATTDPDHIAGGFGILCETCHSVLAWSPANYDHNLTGFPLTGAHASTNCIACHTGGYAGTPTECVACHQTDYDNTTDPNHADANFPADCETCHTTSGWRPSTWDHDGQYFPIYSGAHNGRWADCTECHTVPADFSAFECILCHEHNQTDMDAKHSQVDGYAYLSSECYRCHPRGTH